MNYPNLVLRRATDADWDDIVVADARAFAFIHPLDDEARNDIQSKVTDTDVVVVHDHSVPDHTPLVGVAMFYRMAVTIPGGRRAIVPGLTWVSVAATHRRRGILRMMLTELADQWEREGSDLCILTASEATIYERFGFGPACFTQQTDVHLAQARLRGRPPVDSRVRFGTEEQIAETIPRIHNRWATTRPGAIWRAPTWWNMIFADRPMLRDGRSKLHYLLHADGYASYRIAHVGDESIIEVSELFTATHQAHTDLWRVLLNLDLVTRVKASVPVDDPLPTKLVDRRAVSVTGTEDSLWLRILDIPSALSARTYAGDLDAVLEIADNFRDRGGRFTLHIADGEATVNRTTEPPTLRMDITVLSSIYLGGYRAAEFEAADRLWASDPDTLSRFDSAFATDRAPFAGTYF